MFQGLTGSSRIGVHGVNLTDCVNVWDAAVGEIGPTDTFGIVIHNCSVTLPVSCGGTVFDEDAQFMVKNDFNAGLARRLRTISKH